jgi:hypothetical protein
MKKIYLERRKLYINILAIATLSTHYICDYNRIHRTVKHIKKINLFKQDGLHFPKKCSIMYYKESELWKQQLKLKKQN